MIHRKLHPKTYGDDARALLEHVWALIGVPSRNYLTVVLPLWLPLLQEVGNLTKPFATEQALAELEAMSAAPHRPVLGPGAPVDAATGYLGDDLVAVAAMAACSVPSAASIDICSDLNGFPVKELT